MRGAVVVCLAAAVACGRVGFDPRDDAGRPGGGGSDARASDDASGQGDAGMQTIACANQNLGSATGSDVASGTTAGHANTYMGCSGDGTDVSFGWFAPADGTYRIDLCNSPDQTFDTVLSVRASGCQGTQVACNDDACGGPAGLLSAVTITANAGAAFVIIVDSNVGSGPYQLAITEQ
ncbi:MAG TPA: hypothetical protein VLX92_02440 [Kofleriaceae bacterium]|nr:hypothetical protein [Kofleriaceae bacterium]